MSAQALGQINHFIYLQTDNQQPFYIKHSNRIYSSSASGYLILSKLKEGPVDIAIGFPKSDMPEMKFQCIVDKSDNGYLIKNFGDKGWALFDLQSSVVTYANVVAGPKTNETIISKNESGADDPFAKMLSKVTQDSTVKNVTVTKEGKIADQPKPIKPPPVTTQQPVKDSIKTEVTKEPVQTIQTTVSEPVWVVPAKSAVQQVRRFDSKEGSDFVFEVSESAGQKDTIRLFIERDTTLAIPAPVGISETIPETVNQEKEKVSIAVDSPIVKTENPKKEETKQPATTQQRIEVKPLPNSNCKGIATEDDFIKLRRKMANESKDEAMLSEARKVFKTKCFSTAQVKNLAVLFLNDEGRYRFYDAALLYVTDFSNFKNLGETIQDDYYKKRFQALLPNQ